MKWVRPHVELGSRLTRETVAEVLADRRMFT